MKIASTSNLTFHLKQTHGCLKKYNAYKEYEELNQLKEGQKKKRKQSEWRKTENQVGRKIVRESNNQKKSKRRKDQL